MPCLLVALVVGLAVAPASATVPRDGAGFAIADDTYFVFPDDADAFLARSEEWYGPSLSVLGPESFRFQIHWNADQALIARAKMLADYVRSEGVRQVVVSFKKNGAAPDAAAYGASVARVVAALADRVDAWGVANEPNVGDAWLPGADGARRLAEYWAEFEAAVEARDPSALKLSPEFADRRDLGSIGSYVRAYASAGGGFGDVIGWHAYWGTHATTPSTTDDLLAHVPAGLPVWVTEVGGLVTNAHGAVPVVASAMAQDDKVDWLVDDPGGLATQPRVERLFYYHLRDTGQPDWDSALVGADGRRRPAWYTWCRAANGADALVCDQSLWGYAAGVVGEVRGWLHPLPPEAPRSGSS